MKDKEEHMNVKKSDSFITEIISLMPQFVKEASEFVSLPKNTIILGKSEPVSFAIITVSGEISVVNEFESGKIFEPVILYPNDFTGVVEILLGMKEIISTNIAKTDIEFIKVPSKIFLKWLDESHKLTRYVLNSVSYNFKKNMDESGEGVLLDSMFHFINHLLKNAVYDSSKSLYYIDETRERTSVRTGINLRTLYRHIKKMKDEGMILTHHRQIVFSESQKNSLYDYYLQLRHK